MLDLFFYDTPLLVDNTCTSNQGRARGSHVCAPRSKVQVQIYRIYIQWTVAMLGYVNGSILAQCLPTNLA